MDDKSAAINHVGQIAVAVKDVQRAEAFYRDVLGLKHLFSFPGMTFFDCGGVRLFLSKPEKPEFDKTPVIYYRVASVDAAYARLQARGAHLGRQMKFLEDVFKVFLGKCAADEIARDNGVALKRVDVEGEMVAVLGERRAFPRAEVKVAQLRRQLVLEVAVTGVQDGL